MAVTRNRVNRCPVPDEFMIPIGAKLTQELGYCTDSFTDSDLQLGRSQLPTQYHGVPTDILKIRWIAIRKTGTEGYRLDGKGPTKGSRKAPKYHVPDRFRAWTEGDDFKAREKAAIVEFDNRCSVCYSEYDLKMHLRKWVDVKPKDCIVLCGHCRRKFFASEVDDEQPALF